MSNEGSAQGQGATIDSIIEQLLSDLGDGPVVAFAHGYLRRIPTDFLAKTPTAAVVAQIASVFEFAQSHSGEEASVRVFNPSVADHGYTSLGTVVEVAATDMAFLIDSVTNEIESKGYTVQRVIHPVIGTERDASGKIQAVVPARTARTRESIQHYELEETLSEEERDTLQAGVLRALIDVRRTVADFEPMQGAIYRMIKTARSGLSRYDKEDVDEAIAFLEWLLDENFVFLGYREYAIEGEGDDRAVSIVPDSGLGILSSPGDSQYADAVKLADMKPELRARYESGDLLVITKTNSQSRVHRRARMDYIGVRHIAPDGAVIGEARLLGLFTTKAYMAPADSIPMLRRKLQQIIEAEDLIEGSHVFKEVVQLFNGFPTDELFATPTDAIRESIVGLIQLQENQQIRLFVRRDLLQRNVSVLVVMPRDRFNAPLRKTLQALFQQRFGGNSVDYRLSLGETDTARLHFTVWVSSGQLPDVSIEELEAEVVAAAQTWEERLGTHLIAEYGEAEGSALIQEWAGRFPNYYKSSTPMDIVVGDIGKLDQVARANDGRPIVGLQIDRAGDDPLTRLAVYRANGKLELSQIMPTLEALGLRVVEEVPTRITGDVFIHDFGVLDATGDILDLDQLGDRVGDTVAAVLSGDAESDSLNRLIVTAGLNHNQVRVLRAYRSYWQRVSPGFTIEYINDTFANHPDIAAELVELFLARFDPSREETLEAPIVERIRDGLDDVASLDEDRILRGFLGLITATVRTNAFRNGDERLAFKFRSADVPDMPAPAPLYEIFVYAADVEGIHLRGGRVARGGIRWSTRREDYRTEVLGLMKAQMTKNAVIIPTGSKGGFVLRQSPTDPVELRAAVKSGYVTFISGLLDVTDNLVAGEVIHPEGVRVHDEPDPYLVVAADKGTATFSDTANELSAKYGFWLGDAFASGGSAGYDHKALGITARGAWESVKWHFRELGVDVMNEPFTAVGIGDMSGDVFGNGMLLSPMTKLLVAFDHRNIFIDPTPDPVASYRERQRLFALERSSWEDYDTDLISPGGAVFSRAAKQITLSPEAMVVLGISTGTMTPDEAIKAALSAPVDLLWNGGIGTYVKASDETHDQVGDRANDGLRVDGKDLRCRVIGEGGNLGLTQRGRIEFALKGGRVNTDFIDNSGGVHCSDREVNLKVLLGLAEARGELDRAGRDQLVEQVVDDVVEAILYDNFLQAQILGQDVARSAHHIEAYEDLMSTLEAEGTLDRSIEYLPSTEEMADRSRNNAGMTAPELSVLLAYAKRSLRDWLLETGLPDWDDFAGVAHEYFPQEVVTRYGHLISDHPLRRELIATVVANRVVNSEGVTFATRLMAETGAPADQVVRAYHIARAVIDAPARWDAVESLVGDVPIPVARDLMNGVDGLVEAVARWYLTNPGEYFMRDIIAKAKPVFEDLSGSIADIGPEQWREEKEAEAAMWAEFGVPIEVARRHIYQEELIHAPDIIEVARATEIPAREVATAFMLAGAAFEIDWLESQVDSLPASNRWQRRAVQAVADDLILLRRQLAEKALADAKASDARTAIDSYLVSRTQELGRLTRFMRSIAADGSPDLAAMIVAIRQIRNLI